MLFGRKQALVGLDIGSHTIKAVELEGESSKNYKLIRWGISAPLRHCFFTPSIEIVNDSFENCSSRVDLFNSIIRFPPERLIISSRLCQ